MITEDYVSFEVAKLLKERGFKIPYDSFRGVYMNGIFKRLNPGDGYGHNSEDEIIEVCSLQMAMKWLRETFEIHCQIDCPIAASNWVYGIRDLNQDEWITLRNMGDYETYEEACEAAIKYCLENLI